MAMTRSGTRCASRCCARPRGRILKRIGACSTSATRSIRTPARGSKRTPCAVAMSSTTLLPLHQSSPRGHPAAHTLLRCGRREERRAYGREEGRRRRRAHLPHVRVGRPGHRCSRACSTGRRFAVESNLMEKPEATHLALSSDVVTVPIKPFEILTLSIAYPHASAGSQLNVEAHSSTHSLVVSR